MFRGTLFHFYNRSGPFSMRLQEIGAASLKNFVAACKSWFGRDLSEFNFYLMPLSFVALPPHSDALLLNQEERRFLSFVEKLEHRDEGTASPFAVTVNIDIKFTRSKAKDSLGVQITTNPDAPEVRLTEELIREQYPWDYDQLTEACRKRYKGFKIAAKYHDLRKALLKDKRFGAVRFFDPGNSKSSKKPFFNPNIMAELDKHYSRL
jgi:Domain of unknown function (DUF3644)